MTAVEMTKPDGTPSGGQPLLEVEGLPQYFPVKRGIVIQRHVGAAREVGGLT